MSQITPIPRRGAIAAVGALAVTAVLSGCAGSAAPATSESGAPAAGPVTITYVGYGGAGQDAQIEAWQKPYTEAHPEVTFVNTSPPDVAQVKAQVDAGAVQWDVIATAPYAAEQNCDTLFEPLEIELTVPEGDLVDGAVGECYTANWINATPLAYRTDAFPDGGPETIEDFFDVEKFPGSRGMVTNLQNGILEYAAIAGGADHDDLYPLDVDAALDELDTIRSSTTFAPNVGALQQAVSSGQVDMFFLPDSRIVPLLQEGTDVTVVWDVTIASINAFAVPKGSPNKAAVEDFLASVMEPGPVAKISELLGVAPINSAAEPTLDEFTSTVEAYNTDTNTGTTVLQDIPWYTENFNDASTKLTNWLAG
ncbi:extracellular solute-binding protein [Microbacterium sp. 1.5R]|uniref:extracellular solute-binding protein n=1 Tax=Microbacterium sp. 1.5R TaxID=1916917 RepID=UPI0011A3BCE4|nr:extracellular solute-binding protein [Microbacterium sp. 1.5R]